ncbi:MAG: oligosaccharide flippase family protein [Candidatus Binataceae bacterium]
MTTMQPSLRRNVAWSYVNWIAGFAAPLILIPLYVRLLGHQLYGEWLVIVSIASYLGLANLGSWQAVGNRIAEAIAQDRRDEIGRLMSTGFIAYSAIITAIVLAVFAATPMLTRRMMPAVDGETLVAFYVFIILSALGFPLRAHSVMLRSFERVDIEQRINTCTSICRIAAMAAALLAGFKLVMVAVIQGGATVATGVASYIVAVRLDADARPRMSRWSTSLLGSLVKPSIGFFGLTVASTLAFGVDNLVIGYAMGARAVTQYAVPFRLMTILSGGFTVGISALWPTITRFHSGDRLDELRRGLVMLMRVAFVFGGAAGVALWFLGPGFIRIWAGPGVFPGRATFGLQIVLMVTQMLLTPADAVLMATTRHYGYAALAAVEGALNLGLSLWWVRYWGLAGVIGATVAARLLTNGWYLPVAALRTIGMSGSEFLRALVQTGEGAIANESA